MGLFPLQVGSFFGKLFQLRSIKRHFGIVSSWANLDFIDYHNSPYTKGIAFYFITSHLMDLTWMIPSWLHRGVAKPSRLHWVDVHVKRRFAQSVGCPSSVVPQRFCPESNRLKFDTGLDFVILVGREEKKTCWTPWNNDGTAWNMLHWGLPTKGISLELFSRSNLVSSSPMLQASKPLCETMPKLRNKNAKHPFRQSQTYLKIDSAPCKCFIQV